jgi:hypothetical protein
MHNSSLIVGGSAFMPSSVQRTKQELDLSTWSLLSAFILVGHLQTTQNWHDAYIQFWSIFHQQILIILHPRRDILSHPNPSKLPVIYKLKMAQNIGTNGGIKKWHYTCVYRDGNYLLRSCMHSDRVQYWKYWMIWTHMSDRWNWINTILLRITFKSSYSIYFIEADGELDEVKHLMELLCSLSNICHDYYLHSHQ